MHLLRAIMAMDCCAKLLHSRLMDEYQNLTSTLLCGFIMDSFQLGGGGRTLIRVKKVKGAQMGTV